MGNLKGFGVQPALERARVRISCSPKRVFQTVLFLCLSLICAATLASAQAGSLDPTFGTGGIFTFSTTSNGGGSNSASAIALQSDGKLVVAGQVGSRSGLLRLNTNGTLDTTFGTAGVVVSKLGGVVDQLFVGLAIQSDGKIVVSATGIPARGQVGRFNPNGSPDTTFGTAGVASLSMTAGLLVLQTDGRIIVTGASAGNASMARLQSNGQLDTSFGTNGQAPLAAGAGSITLQADGKILIGSGAFAAAAVLNPANGAGAVARYNTNGSLDKSFGISGLAASIVAPSALAVQSDGKILAAGSNVSQLALSGNVGGFGLVRLNSNGSVDTTLGTRGGVTTAFPGASLTDAFAVILQSNGDIVAAGEAGNAATSQLTESFALARYLGTGKLDSTFGTGGLVTTNFGNTAAAFITSLVLQSDGKIVAAGSNAGNTVEVARYLGQ